LLSSHSPFRPGAFTGATACSTKITSGVATSALTGIRLPAKVSLTQRALRRSISVTACGAADAPDQATHQPAARSALVDDATGGEGAEEARHPHRARPVVDGQLDESRAPGDHDAILALQAAPPSVAG